LHHPSPILGTTVPLLVTIGCAGLIGDPVITQCVSAASESLYSAGVLPECNWSKLNAHAAQMASWALHNHAPRAERAQDALAAAWCRSSQHARALVAWQNVIHKLHAVRLSLTTGAARHHSNQQIECHVSNESELTYA